jgi:hypothetical protein
MTTLLSKIAKRLRGKRVDASNAARAAKKEGNVIPASFAPAENELARGRALALKVMAETGGDEELLLRASRQMALLRLFNWLGSPDESCELKDAIAGLQRLAAIVPDANEAKAEGVDEAEIARIRSELNLF